MDTQSTSSSVIPPPPVFEEQRESFVFKKSHVTGKYETVRFGQVPLSTTERGYIVIPLLLVIKKFCNLSHAEKEPPIFMCWGQLARLRSLLYNTHIFNTIKISNLENNDTEEGYIVDRYLALLSDLGYTVNGMVNGKRTQVILDDMEDFIVELESAFASIIEDSRLAIETCGPIDYMGLQELYPIGSIVVSDKIGAIGGTEVAFRVIDSYYEPIVSFLGKRKYSYWIVLESIVCLGGEFVSVSFPHSLELWVGGKEMLSLPYIPLELKQLSPALLKSRTDFIRSVTSKPTFKTHNSGCFYPRVASGYSNKGVSDSQRVSAGQIVIDTKLGLELGHPPISTTEEIGAAVMHTMKHYKTVARTLKENVSDRARIQSFKDMHLRLWTTLPEFLGIQIWPTVVCFSLTIKQWGHVIIDGLSDIGSSQDAWNGLVLPFRTKEMLLAMAYQSVKGNEKVTNNDKLNPEVLDILSSEKRYILKDMVDGKNDGTLFLLYGPPGTGKTLSVQALASYFGRPLYSISFSELGSTVSELEERLSEVLTLAAHWGALVLLDEGDALVERRERGRLLLNSMTGVLLKLLESFEGAMFITSNRASEFDPAALSRVTLAIKYESLDENSRRIVWRNTLVRILAEEMKDGAKVRNKEEAQTIIDEQFDIERLATFVSSGRGVNAIAKLAIGLAEYRKLDLNQDILDDALEVFKDFHIGLEKEGVYSDWK
eukprot:TRINITY_DN4696_c0_g1_i1.p1 TRINITY_DN4696_c0_g1~~TRINITY_DN4696_c0_g1_i1.p1  ORF type:complete len:797 (+),score=160.58 TRINITY_DN4696_c0_g1_i1:255-2393(+)